MGILSHLRPPGRAAPSEWASVDGVSRFRRGGRVNPSSEINRVLSLSRRPPIDLNSAMGEALVEMMMERFGLGPRKCLCASKWGRCLNQLNAAQAWALYEAPLANGLLAPLGVGSGKTLLNILMALAIPDVKLAVLLIPPGNRQQLFLEYQRVKEHFKVPSFRFDNGEGSIVPKSGWPIVHVVPYSTFSRPESTVLLEGMKPDLVIADEGHAIRNRTAARTGRLLRYFANHSDTRLCVWSGTLIAKSICDVAHLAALSLGEGSPLPLDPHVVEEWSQVIDPSSMGPGDPGPLTALMNSGDTLQNAIHRRIVETRGVVSTKAGSIGASINIIERVPPAMPRQLKEMLREVRSTWVRPDGEELVEALAVAASCRQLACGFYYRWVFPHGESESLIQEWFFARKAWNKELRSKLRDRSEHLDSPMLCANAAVRYYEGYDGDLPTWNAESWPRWQSIKDKVYHETRVVWVDDYLARDAAAWASENRGIVWYDYDAFGQMVGKVSGLPVHGGGVGAEASILSEKGDRSIVASIKSHGVGRDGLQRLFNCQLVATPPSGGDAWEQLQGRLHRLGQEADEVNTWVYRHTAELAESIDKAVQLAKFVEGVQGTHQKLLAANCDFLRR